MAEIEARMDDPSRPWQSYWRVMHCLLALGVSRDETAVALYHWSDWLHTSGHIGAGLYYREGGF